LKIGVFAKTEKFGPKFQVKGVVRDQPFFVSEN